MIRKGSLLLVRKCSHLLVVLKVALLLLLCLETVGCWVSKVSLKVARVLLLALVGVGSLMLLLLLLLARRCWFCFWELNTLLCDGWLANLTTLWSLIVLLKVQQLL